MSDVQQPGGQVNCENYEELITGAIDSELSPEEQKLLENHMKTCQSCRSAYEMELWFKTFVREKLGGRRAPADVVNAIENGIRDEGVHSPASNWIDRLKAILSVPLVRPALALGILVIVTLLFLRGGSHGDVVEQSLANYQKAVSGEVELQLASGEPVIVRQFFAGKTDFPVLVPELHSHCTLLGGILEEYPGGAIAKVFYVNNYAKMYLYQTGWEATESGDGPTITPEVRAELLKTNLYSSTDPNGRTVLLWRKGPTLACAVSDMSKSYMIFCLTSGDPGLLNQ